MKELKKEQALLLCLLRYAIHERKEELPEDLTEQEIPPLLKEASAQAVRGMALYGLLAMQDRFSDKTKKNIKGMVGLVIRSNTAVSYTQSKLVKLLDKHGFSYVILKGDAAASYYPEPELRMRGDIDFLIDPEEKNNVEKMLMDAGYARSSEGHVCHVVFKKPGEHLEMHFEPAGIPNGEIGQEVRTFLKDTLENRVFVPDDLGGFFAPSPLYHAMILLLHMQHHMLGEGMGLRHMCDWACFVRKTCGQPFWEQLLPFLRKIGLFTFTAVMTRTCAIYLDTPCPSWAEQADTALCDNIMDDIFTGGNFGRKDAVRSKSSVFISNHGKDGTTHSKFYYMCYTIHHSTINHFPKLKKVYILYPFLYVIRITRYLCMIAQKKRPPLHGMLAMAQERRELYQELHVFERD